MRKLSKLKLSGTVIDIVLFRCSVVVLVGKDVETILNGLPDLSSDCRWSEDVQKDIGSLIKASNEEDEIKVGATFHYGVDAVVVILEDSLPEVSEETAVHELYHAMKHICRAHGVDDEETEAYMLEYLFNQFLDAQDNYKEQLKKEKRHETGKS